MAKCKRCGKKFKFRKSKIYCSRICRTRENAYKDYYKYRDNSEYKRKKEKYWKKWLDRNRAHFNDLCREPNRLRRRELGIKWENEGKCFRCGRERDDKRWKTCSKCREKRRKS